MKTTTQPKAFGGGLVVALLSASTLISMAGPSMARAGDDEARTPPSPPQASRGDTNGDEANPAPASTCVIAGEGEPPRKLAIFAQASGDQAIAELTGASIELEIRGIRAAGRSRVVVDPKGLGLTGYVDATKLTYYGSRPLPVVPSHVWLSGTQELTLVGATSEGLRVQAKVSSSIHQTFETSVPCDALALQPSHPEAREIPGDARAFISKGEQVELYDTAGKSSEPLVVLHVAPWAEGIVFHSTRNQGAYVHVEHRGDVIASGWTRWGQVRGAPRGELIDQVHPPVQRKISRLKLSGEPKLVTLPEDALLRSSAEGDPIGTARAGTKLYVIDHVASYVRVLPERLHVTGPEMAPFWMPATALTAPESPEPSPKVP